VFSVWQFSETRFLVAVRGESRTLLRKIVRFSLFSRNRFFTDRIALPVWGLPVWIVFSKVNFLFSLKCVSFCIRTVPFRVVLRVFGESAGPSHILLFGAVP